MIKKVVEKDHWFGEGTGGSGHLASVSLGDLKIISHKEIDFRKQPGTEVIYSYRIDRQSEFGGETYVYKKKAVLDKKGIVLDSHTLEEKVYDLLTGEERDDFRDLIDSIDN